MLKNDIYLKTYKSNIRTMSRIRIYDVNYQVIECLPMSYYKEQMEIVGFLKEITYGNNFLNFNTIPIFEWDYKHPVLGHGVLYGSGRKLNGKYENTDILSHFYINQMESMGYCEFGNKTVLGKHDTV